MDKTRETALKVLYDVDTKNAYSNIVLSEILDNNRNKLNEKDVGLISELVYGTVSWKLTIDYIISKYSNIKINKISKWILNILRMATYQIIFLDKIPKSAAVNEAVNLAKKYGGRSTGFVNAILRKVEKTDYEELKNIENNVKRISLLESMPEWLVEELLKDYSIKEVEEICRCSNTHPKVTIRINALKTDKAKLIKQLEKRNIQYEETEEEEFINLKVKNLANIDLFKEGLFTAQDISAGKTAKILSPKEGDVVLDACSAPGGKTTHLAEIMNNKGKIIAWDLYNSRLNLVKQNAERLGIDIIETEEKDSSIFEDKYINKFDNILLDVPCLGIGVIKRKPDIKWQRKKEDIEEISRIQLNILENCSKYLKKGGELVYSTCSILKAENEDLIRRFLKDNNKFEIVKEIKIKTNEEADGFYICKIKSK